MPSFLPTFNHNWTRSQLASSASARPTQPEPAPAVVAQIDPPAPAPITPSRTPSRLARKIHPNLSALVNEDNKDDDDDFPPSPTPTQPKHGSFTVDQPKSLRFPPLADKSNAASSSTTSPTVDTPSSPQNNSFPLSGSSEWSTFGRNQQQTGRPDEFGQLVAPPSTGIMPVAAERVGGAAYSRLAPASPLVSIIAEPTSPTSFFDSLGQDAFVTHSAAPSWRVSRSSAALTSTRSSSAPQTPSHPHNLPEVETPRTFGRRSHSLDYSTSPPPQLPPIISSPLLGISPRRFSLGNTISFPSLPFSLGRSFLSRRTDPAFVDELGALASSPVKKEEDYRRRSSVDWTTKQVAVEGSWQSLLAEEMVRLAGAGAPNIRSLRGESSPTSAAFSTGDGLDASNQSNPGLIPDISRDSTPGASPLRSEFDAAPTRENGMFLGSVGDDQRKLQKGKGKAFTGTRRRAASGSSIPRRRSGSGVRRRPSRPTSPPAVVTVASAHTMVPSDAVPSSSLSVPQVAITEPTPRPTPVDVVSSTPVASGSNLQVPVRKRGSVGGKRKSLDDEDESYDSIGALTPGTLKGVLVNSPNGKKESPPGARRRKRVKLSSDQSYSQDSPHPVSPSSTRRYPTSSTQPASSIRSFPSTLRAPSTPGREQSLRTSSLRSIPVSAIMSPSPRRSLSPMYSYHMRDPTRLPPAISYNNDSTAWDLGLRSGNAPPHAWLFLVGFLLPFAWWIGSIWTIKASRSIPETKSEHWDHKHQVYERYARVWRFRCRILSAISLIVYVPLVILAIVFTR